MLLIVAVTIFTHSCSLMRQIRPLWVSAAVYCQSFAHCCDPLPAYSLEGPFHPY